MSWAYQKMNHHGPHYLKKGKVYVAFDSEKLRTIGLKEINGAQKMLFARASTYKN